MRKFCVVIIMTLTILLSVVGCESTQKKKNSEFSIELNTKAEYMIVGEQYRLAPRAGDSVVDLKWESDDKSVADVKEGLITAVSAGECNITVSSEVSKAICKVIVSDSMVSKEFDKKSLDFGVKRFDKIQSAVNYGGTVLVFQGNYEEQLIMPNKVQIIAVGNVKVLSVYGSEFSVKGVTIQTSDMPQENKSLVYAEKSMILDKCSIIVSTSDSSELLKGGSAVSIASDGQKLIMTDCNISNVAEGLSVSQFSGEIKCLNNNFVNCGTGILINVRATGKMIEDYPASGIIRGNTFLTNKTSCKFMYSGDSYNGKLEFYDYSKIAPKANNK